MKTGVIVGVSAFCLMVAAGSALGYIVATKPEVRERFVYGFKDAFQTSRQKIADMSEDVAVRTARMTKNPKITQDWVAHQWESVGY